LIREAVDFYSKVKREISNKIRQDLTDKEFEKVNEFNKKIVRVIYNIAKFSTMLWIFNKIHNNLGMEKALIILLILIFLAIINQGRK
jgi:hypothetical protein